MDDRFIHLRVVYEDVDLIELAITVQCGAWSAHSKAYTSAEELARHARSVLDWIARPDGRVTIEAGADTGIGWMVLTFYTVGLARHACCSLES